MDDGLAVEVSGLKKHFGAVEALAGLDLRVPAGAFYAFLGPNGAGKSTTLSLLTGLLAPDAGEIRLFGESFSGAPIALKARVGVVPETLALFERLTGRQQLTFSGRLYGLSAQEAAGRAEELLDVTELSGQAEALVAGYSKGMRRRLAIASALIHAPRLVFLDEPFEGIDVLAAGVIRALLAELSRSGVTLVLTTHVLEIADRLATHAGFIQAGRLLDEGSLGELRERHRSADLQGVFERLISVPAARSTQLSFYPARGR